MRYVDDTLAAVKDIPTATAFLSTLNEARPAISFTMEVANNSKLNLSSERSSKRLENRLKTCVYRKITNKGLLLHYQGRCGGLMVSSLDPWASTQHSAIGKHLRDAHNLRNKDLQEQFTILKNCRGKFECLNLWNALCPRKETLTEHSIWLN